MVSARHDQTKAMLESRQAMYRNMTLNDRHDRHRKRFENGGDDSKQIMEKPLSIAESLIFKGL